MLTARSHHARLHGACAIKQRVRRKRNHELGHELAHLFTRGEQVCPIFPRDDDAHARDDANAGDELERDGDGAPRPLSVAGAELVRYARQRRHAEPDRRVEHERIRTAVNRQR